MAEEVNAHVAEKEDVNDDVTEKEEVTDDVIENEGLNNDVAEKEEANDDILLYPNWVRSIGDKDGSSFECYKNSQTGQTFYSREDLTRYLTYVTEVRPVLGDKGFCPDGLPKEHKGKKGKAVRRRSAAMAGVKQKKSLSGKVKSCLSGKVKKSLSGKVNSSLSGKVKKSFSGKVKKLQLG